MEHLMGMSEKCHKVKNKKVHTRLHFCFVFAEVRNSGGFCICACLSKSARHDHTDLIAMQRRPIADEVTWASRNFTAWARQRLSTQGLVGICIDAALRRDAIAALPSRGRGVIDHRRPGYAPLRSATDDAPSGLLHHMRDAAAQAASAP